MNKFSDQWDKSASRFEMIPAKESSEKPMTMRSDSYFLSTTLAVDEDDMLLRVSAANWINFSWFFICCRIPITMLSKQSLLSNSYLAMELISDTKASI